MTEVIRKRKDRAKAWAGFTLVELLLVIGIMVLLLSVVVPSVSQVGDAYNLAKEGQAMNDRITLARQLAMSKNCDVELRFYASKTPEGMTTWSTQLWQFNSASGTYKEISAKSPVSHSIVVVDNDALSPLLSKLKSGANPDKASEVWNALRFRPNGRTAATLDNSNNFITLQLRRDEGNAKANYYTLQINQLSGQVKTYRP